jgi:hypothetical protein
MWAPCARWMDQRWEVVGSQQVCNKNQPRLSSWRFFSYLFPFLQMTPLNPNHVEKAQPIPSPTRECEPNAKVGTLRRPSDELTTQMCSRVREWTGDVVNISFTPPRSSTLSCQLTANHCQPTNTRPTAGRCTGPELRAADISRRYELQDNARTPSRRRESDYNTGGATIRRRGCP